MSGHYPQIQIRTQLGGVLVQQGLAISFFMSHSHDEVAPAIQRTLEAFLRAVGREALSDYADNEGELQPLDDAGWDFIWSRLREPSATSIQLRDDLNGERYHFEYWGREMKEGRSSAVSFGMPTGFLEEHGPGRVRELAVELAALLPFRFGHAGLAFNGALLTMGVAESISTYCFRYPGIDIPQVESLSYHLGTQVTGPHWMNFLAQPVLRELGGVDGLRARLQAPGTSVEALAGDRALVILGHWPEAGDTEAGDALPAYREFARVLESRLFRKPNSLMEGLPSEDAVRRWERRFLD